MDKKIKRAWMKALRSGKYKKGLGALHPTDDTFCCLGVLAKIQGKKIPVDMTQSHLPPNLARKAGLDLDIQINLARRNDGSMPFKRKHSFKKIADWIEKNL